MKTVVTFLALETPTAENSKPKSRTLPNFCPLIMNCSSSVAATAIFIFEQVRKIGHPAEVLGRGMGELLLLQPVCCGSDLGEWDSGTFSAQVSRIDQDS